MSQTPREGTAMTIARKKMAPQKRGQVSGGSVSSNLPPIGASVR
jgi:hypothetical protein